MGMKLESRMNHTESGGHATGGHIREPIPLQKFLVPLVEILNRVGEMTTIGSIDIQAG